jgi:serine-type D-Ala-D-Ala carboxypeptidase/endopeptidase
MRTTMRLFVSVPLVALALLAATASTRDASGLTSLPSSVEVRALLIDHIDAQHKCPGMVVGIIAPAGRRIIAYGVRDQNDPRPLDGDTIFEIGSVTKVFTALLLADMVQRHEVALSDPVATYLPAGVRVPELNGRRITLVDLATHTSGLPFMPSNMGLDFAKIDSIPLTQIRDAYARYSDADLLEFLSTCQLGAEIGTQWSYSNVDAGLLGRALANRAGTDFKALLRARITGPLGMKSTAITVSPAMRRALATGHNARLELAPEWALPALEGAGSLRSSANDLLTLLGAFMGYVKPPLAPSMAATLQTRRPGPNLQQALGWWIIPFGPGDEGIVTSAGTTFGFSATVAYDPKTRIGVVVLSNSSASDGGLAWHLLRPAWPVETSAATKAREQRKEVAMDPRQLDLLVGEYQPPEPTGVITIERQGDGLVFRSDSVPQGLRLHAEDERNFFVMEADLRLTFEVDVNGISTGVILRFGGIESRASRTASASTIR